MIVISPMDLLSKEFVSGAMKHDWRFLLKLLLSGVLTAIGVHEMGFNLELSFVALIFIPAGGMFFTFLRQEADSNIMRWISIVIIAALFGMLIESWYLAVAAFLIMEGATHSSSLVRYEDAKWMKIVRAESSMDELNALVSGHTLFQKLPEQARLTLAEKSTVMEVEAGAALIKQGEFNNYLFLMAKGETEVIRNGEVVASLHPGNIFGEVSASGLSLPVADVVARTEVTAFAFPIDLITETTEAYPAFAEQLHNIGMRIVIKHGETVDAGSPD